ncbi:MAG: TonB-dependent hemoglobin/transferrin/lactoferrin family receptor [Pseudomonadota bacterium]
MGRQFFLLMSTALVLPVLPTTVAAQDGSLGLGTIVLSSALRTDRALIDTPVSVSTIDAEELALTQATSFEELIGDAAGISIGGGPRVFSQEINIRGFQDEQVVLRFDGARFSYNQAHRGRFFIDPALVQRVEVVRGGGSTLFGSGAIGGVVSVETKDPSDLLLPGQTVGARISTGVSTNGETYNGNVAVYGDWGQFDALAFLGGQTITTDLESGNGSDIRDSQLDQLNGLIKFGFEPTDEHRLEFSYSFYDDDGTTPTDSTDVATNRNAGIRKSTVETARLGWDYNPVGNDLIDLSVLAYTSTVDLEEQRNRDGRFDTSDYKTVGFEVVNRSEFERFTLVYGFEYLRDEQDGTRNGAVRTQFPNSEAETTSVFAEATFALNDRFDLIAGARFDAYDRDVDDPTLPDASDEFFSPRVGFSYRPNDNWQVYGNVARAFRAPTLTELYNDGVHFATGPFAPFPLPPGTTFTGVNNFVPTPGLRPEKATNIDLGVRFENTDVFGPGDSLSVSGNVYYADVEDFIDLNVLLVDFATLQPVGPGAFLVNGTSTHRNIDATLYGFEAEVDYDAGSWFAKGAVTAPQGEGAGGQRLGTIPQTRFNTTFGFRPNADWTYGFRTTWAFERNQPPTGVIPADSYQLVDLFAVWAPQQGPLQNTVVRFGIDNAFDQEYNIYPNDLPQPGRSFKVSASHRF